MKTVGQIINEILRVEGEAYTNHPSDRGGPTKWGVTLATLQNFFGRPCTATDVQMLTRETAYKVYEWLYVLGPRLDQVVARSPSIGAEVIDTGVNCGTERSVKFLQRSLNAFNKRGSLYPDVAVDGIIGRGTLDALSAFITHRQQRGVIVLLRALDACQGEYYLSISESRPQNEDFTFGWFEQRVGLQS